MIQEEKKVSSMEKLNKDLDIKVGQFTTWMNQEYVEKG
jgi:hypothetical protein